MIPLRKFRPVIATEIEFYLFGSKDRDLAGFWQEVRESCKGAGIAIFKIEKEKGVEQHEVALCPARDRHSIIVHTQQLKAIVTEIAEKHAMQASFAAKPLPDEPGNGLHVHVHLEDEAGNNLYHKDDEVMSDPLAHSIAGLLALLPEQMAIFAPTEQSRARFVAGSNAPTTISWGANNRSCAIRLPDKAWDNKHIEHRVAGADADVEAVIEAILRAIEYGMEHRLTPPPQMYGDASLTMYGCLPLIAG